jgi:hypothetical protein
MWSNNILFDLKVMRKSTEINYSNYSFWTELYFDYKSNLKKYSTRISKHFIRNIRKGNGFAATGRNHSAINLFIKKYFKYNIFLFSISVLLSFDYLQGENLRFVDFQFVRKGHAVYYRTLLFLFFFRQSLRKVILFIVFAF